MTTMNFSEADFKTWFKQNKRGFLIGMGPNEIVFWAKFCYFDESMAIRVLSHFQDAMQGSNFDNRAKMLVDCEIMAINRQSGKPSLKEQWMHLYNKLEHGRDYDGY